MAGEGRANARGGMEQLTPVRPGNCSAAPEATSPSNHAER